jgi:hypothetical protein
LLLVAAGVMGCGDLLDASDYGVEPETPNPCGELEVPTPEGCIRVGVADCGDGFTSDDEGGCVPVLPDASCPPGGLAYPGRVVCGTVGVSLPCPFSSDPRQLIDNYAMATRHVWADAADDGDGTREAPHRTIQAAVDAASPGELILVSPGTYEENLVIDKSLTLRAVCAELVHVVGAEGGLDATITVAAGKDEPVDLVALQISGPGAGVRADESWLRITDSWIHDAGAGGAQLLDSNVEIGSSLFEGVSGVGVGMLGGTLSMTESAIRDVSESDDRIALGRGVAVGAHRFGAEPAPGQLVLDRVLIERTRDAAIHVEGSVATIRRVTIREQQLTQRGASLGLAPAGAGIVATLEPARYLASSVSMDQVVIDGAWGAGIRAFGADVDVQQTTVRGMRSPAPPCRAHALRAIGTSAAPAHVDVRRSTFRDGRGSGVHVMGADVTLSRTIVRDTGSEPCGEQMGDGVAVYVHPDARARPKDARVVVSRSRIESSARSAALSVGAELVVDATLLAGEGAVIRRTGFAVSDAAVPSPPRITLQGSSRCAAAGLLTTCRIIDGPVEPDLFPRNPAGERLPSIGVGADVDDGLAGVPVPSALVWFGSRDEIPVSVADDEGRWLVEAIPAQDQLLVFMAAKGFHGLALSLRTKGVSLRPPATAMLPIEITTAEFPNVLGAPLDFSRGFIWATISGEVPVSDVEPDFPPAFIRDGTPTFEPDPDNSDAFLLGLPTKVVDISFQDAFGSPLSCTLDEASIRFGLPGATPSGIALPVLAGVMMRFGPADCSPP